MTSADTETQRYLDTTPRSRALAEAAREYLPGGDSRTTAFWRPYPLSFTDGDGCHVRDADGVERIDFAANFTSLVLGYGNRPVTEAIERQARRGLGFYGVSEAQTQLARALCERVPSLDQVRFTNSGTEATMNCIRAARAFTGRSVIAKCEGGYHGSHDAVSPGDPHRSLAVRDSPGVTSGTVQDVFVLPFNDAEEARRLLLEHRNELAAVIVEPMLGTAGMIPAEPGFLETLRDVTREHGAVLIFDEVITLRLAPGGAQSVYGILPDLTAMGKFIGGGLPVGAFGGRRELMSLYDPTTTDDDGRPTGPVLSHSGSFNANPVVMAAGAATLEQLTPEEYARLNGLGERVREGVRRLLAEMEVPGQVTGMGSLFGIHLTARPVRRYRDVAAVDPELRRRVFLGLLNEGVLLASQLVGCVTAPMGPEEADSLVEALRRVLGRVL